MVNFKMIIKAIVNPLSFFTGIFPHGLKISRDMPIFKSGGKNMFSNYRPISILPQLSRMLINFLRA